MERDDDPAGWIQPDNMQEKKNVMSLAGKREYAKETHGRYGYISYDTLRTLPNSQNSRNPVLVPRPIYFLW